MKQSKRIQELISISERLNQQAIEYSQLPSQQLEKRPNKESWNTLECFQHLNYYIEIYNKHFQEALSKANSINGDQELKHGYWGQKFIRMMEPQGGKSKKMKTFKSKDPKGLAIQVNVIKEFVELNKDTIAFLEMAKNKDIQNSKCKLAIPVLRLNLGDAFQFIIQHNLRHFSQVERILS